MKTDWTAADIPDLSGKVAVVTGANVGLGLEIATRLAEHDATVVLACRNVEKATSAQTAILQAVGDKSVTIMQLDVSSFASVRSFAEHFSARHHRLDIVMCNAGVMAMESRMESVDGYELQFATNHLGHFLLIHLLLPLLARTPGSRVVTQSSSGNWAGTFEWDNLNADKSYDRWKQYSLTKLANIAFANELNARIAAAGLQHPKAFSVHPGLVVGQLQSVSAGDSSFYKMVYGIFGFFAGTYQTGALPALFACTSEQATIGEFYGPNGFYRGVFSGNHPKAVFANVKASDPEQIKKLWHLSEEMVGEKYDFDAVKASL